MPVLVVFNSVKPKKKEFRKKIINDRKDDFKNMKTMFDGLRKKEISRCKNLWEEHIAFFDESKEPEVSEVINPDVFFEK